MGACPPCRGWRGGERSTGAYTARKIFEARPAPGTRQSGPPLPAMCWPSQVLPGGRCRGRGPWGFCCWGIWALGLGAGGWKGQLGSWPHSCCQPKIPLGRVLQGLQVGDPPPVLVTVVTHRWGSSSPWRVVGLGMRPEPSRLPVLSSPPEIAPRDRPARAAAAQSVSPPVPTLSLSRGLGGPSGSGTGRDAAGWSGDAGGLACVPCLQDLSPSSVSYKHHEQ